MSDKVQFNVWIDSITHNKLQHICVDRKMSMRQAVEVSIEAWVMLQEKLNARK